MGKKKTEKKKDNGTLRDTAEEVIAQLPGGRLSEIETEGPAALIHELWVHQIELQIQNEELKDARSALEEARDKYRDLYDFSPVGYFTITPRMLIAEVNLSGASLLGAERRKLIDGRFRRFVTAGDRDRWDRHFLDVLKSGEKQSCELLLSRVDGTTFFARLESIRMQEKGEAPVVRTVVSDISERKRMEEALSVKTMLLEAQSETSIDGILAMDSDGCPLTFNKSFVELWKVPRDLLDAGEKVSMLKYMLTQLKDPEEFAREVEYLCEHRGEKSKGEARFADGRYLESYSSPLLDADGQYLGRSWFFRDVTGRKRVEQQGQLARQVLELLNCPSSFADIIRNILRLFKDGIDVTAVGIRLRDGDDFPYYDTDGFSEEFVRSERSLCAHDREGVVIRNGKGKPVLECMCGSVIGGRANPKWPFFTERGSFWSNDTSDLLALAKQGGCRGRIRNRCNAEGYQSVALIPLRSADEMLGLLQLNDLRRDQFTPGMVSFFEGLGASIGIALSRRRAEEELLEGIERLRLAVGTTIQVMVSIVEARDPYTASHQLRSADVACAIASEMKLPQEKIEGIRIAGSIHDIGKLSIPAEILSKPKKLSETEFDLVKAHVETGYKMLKNVDSPWPLAEIVYQHHERMDGSGYPRNLKGDNVMMEARILAVADVVEAMASHRPYRPALGVDAAMEEIEKNRGILYDADVVDICLRLFRKKEYRFPEPNGYRYLSPER